MNNNDPRLGKNYFIALALTMLILMGYPFLLRMFVKPAPPQRIETAVSENSVPDASRTVSETRAAAETYIQNPNPPSTEYFENRYYKISFSTLGATVARLHFKGEEGRLHTETTFYEAEASHPGLFSVEALNHDTDLTKVNFKMVEMNDQRARFVYEKPGDFRVTKSFIFSNNNPLIVLQVSYDNLSAAEKNVPLQLTWGFKYAFMDQAEEHQIEALAATDKVRTANIGKVAKKGFFAAGDVQWSGVVKKYFAILVKADNKTLSYEARSSDSVLWATIRQEPLKVAPAAKAESEFLIYAGPQRYETLKNLGLGFEEILSRGFFGTFKIWLLIALKFLYGFVHNYGWAIILLTLLLKGAFTPLTHMSYESMKKMQAIQPKLKSLQERYKNDPTKLNREMMELYRRNKVNPMAGCLPMLAQIPVFIAFYQVLNETIELKGAPFMAWITDLSQPDALFTLPFSIPFLGEHFSVLPLLMIASMWGQQKLTPTSGMPPEQAKMMEFMPIIFGFLFYKMPSGLVLYWFVNNLLTILHQVFIKRMVIVLHHEDRD